MTTLYGNNNTQFCQFQFNQSPLVAELEDIFASIPYKRLLNILNAEKTRAFSPLGRPGYPLEALLKGLLSSYYLNLKNTAHLVRRLQEDVILSIICGFDPHDIPHRSTFSRFEKKLIQKKYAIDECFDHATSELKKYIPGFGGYSGAAEPQFR